jgi:hypothetical protein
VVLVVGGADRTVALVLPAVFDGIGFSELGLAGARTAYTS